MTATVIVVFAILGLLNMPLAFALGFASLAALIASGTEIVIMPQRMMYAVNSFSLMAIPLFMIAGEIMVKAGILHRLVDFANSMVGRVQGGLAHATIISGAILAAVTGAAVASASALGSTLVPMLRKYYGDGFTSGLIASASNLGPIIPPSNAMIVYALMAGSSVSVGALFIAGIVPGIILALGMMALSSIIAKRRGFPLTGEPFNLREVLGKTRKAFVIFMMPVIVIGGIIGGAFTPTEGAAIAVAYAAFIGFFVTGEFKLHHLPGVMFRAAVGSAVVAALIAFASTVTFIFTIDLVPAQLAAFLKSVTDSPTAFMIMVMLMLVVVGMFIESNAAYIMLVPLFAPIAASYGIDPLWFGFLFVLNLVIGMMTPPVGVLLFVMSGVSGVSMGTMIRETLPFTALQFGVLILCFTFPPICLWLPRALGF